MNYFSFPPTPIHPLVEKLNNNKYFIKRDDLLPISFGGNKVRKAILFFEDFRKKNADCIVTYGASSSNHCRVIANLSASIKIPCYIITPSELIFPTNNKKMIELFDAKIIESPVSKVSETINNTLENLRKKGLKPYFIKGGGHGILGTQAYINAYKEILDFEQTNNIYFDYIFHTSGTGTTQAGLICGKIINKDNRKIVGISNARKNPYGKKVVLESVNEYLESNGFKGIDINEILFIDDYVLNGYGSYNAEIIQTIKEVLIKDGIPLDITYTGKAFWGMKRYILKNEIRNKNILFIHTGGMPLFFDKLEEL